MAGCAKDQAGDGDTDLPGVEPPASSPTPRVLPANTGGFALDTVARNLDVPWALDFAPDGRIFLTERPGRIRVIQSGVLRDEPWAELDVYAYDPSILPESGLMGIALSPDFANDGHVYVMGTFWKTSRSGLRGGIDRIYRRMIGIVSGRAAIPYENRVYRLTDEGGTGVRLTLLIDNLPANYYHAGGALAFGPDGKLYIGIGEALASRFETSTEKGSGSILRYEADGSIPADNPVPGSAVYATGLRNPQAFAWHPSTGIMLTTEHGPSFRPHERGLFGKDELNVVTPGANFGWPAVAGRSGDARFVDPIAEWSPAIAPAGVAVYAGDYAAWQGNVFVSGLRGQQLRRVAFDSAALAAGRLVVTEEEPLLFHSLGRIRAVRTGPDGELWITTSNRDGRGQPTATGDLLLRTRPAGSGSGPR